MASRMQKHYIVPGMEFGNWEVIEESIACMYTVTKGNRRRKCRKRFMLCECVCGTRRRVQLNNLLNGQSTGCGCDRVEAQQLGYRKWIESFPTRDDYLDFISSRIRDGFAANRIRASLQAQSAPTKP